MEFGDPRNPLDKVMTHFTSEHGRDQGSKQR